jgi:hypothetical protein
VPTRQTARDAKLTLDLQHATLHALRRSYAEINSTFFKGQLRAPTLTLTGSSRTLGRWRKQDRTLEISWELLAQRSWGAMVEVLKHEMAHQYVDEVLRRHQDPAHGTAFRAVCQERGIDARASGTPVDRVLPDEQGRVLERVTKLLALAQSPNEHEAQSAALAAQRLMLKYNLKNVATQGARGYGFRHLGRSTGRTSESERILAAILGEHFFVEAIWVPVWRPLEGKRGTVLEVCGTPENLELAEYAHSFLTHTAERLWREYKRAHGIRRNADRRSFHAGVMSGFREKLARQKRAQERQGLVWVGDGDLIRFLRQRHPYVRHTRHVSRHRAEVYGHGKEAGRGIVLHRGIQHGPGKTPHLLRSGR